RNIVPHLAFRRNDLLIGNDDADRIDAPCLSRLCRGGCGPYNRRALRHASEGPMSTFRCGRVVGVLIVLLVAEHTASARYWLGPSSTLLRYRLKQGDQLRYTIERKSLVGTQFGDAKERVTKNNQVLEVLQTIGEVKGGVARVSFKIERLRLTVEREGIA